jgi:hypothetical protein
MAATVAGTGMAGADELRRPGVRPANQYGAELAEEARARSATVRDLEQAIQSSDIVVYVICDWRPVGGTAAHLRWLSEAAGIRYVAVFVDIQASPTRRIELLGHELRHVVELADAAWVHNDSDMRKLYEQIGHRTSLNGPHARFETVAARTTEQQVRRDLWAGAAPGNDPVMTMARR